MKKLLSILLAVVIVLVCIILRTKKRSWGIRLSENYALELQVFQSIRKFKDGIIISPLEIDGSWYKGDHNPQFRIGCILFNYCIYELNIYNVNHVEEDEAVTDPTPSSK